MKPVTTLFFCFLLPCCCFLACKPKTTKISDTTVTDSLRTKNNNFEVLETVPIFTEIEGFLEKQNGKWMYRDYNEMMLDTGDQEIPMKPLKTRKCK